MPNYISTIGEHVESWCPYAKTELLEQDSRVLEAINFSASPDIDENQAKAELQKIAEQPCAYVHDGICRLVVYAMKKSFQEAAQLANSQPTKK